MSNFWDTKWTKDYGVFYKKYYITFGLLNDNDIKKSLLDIGSGNGNFFDLISEHSFKKEKLYVNDLSIKALQICKEKGYTVVENIYEDKKKHDVIIMIDILEHIENPYDFLNNLNSRTKEFIIVVPNFNSNKQRIEVLQGKIPFQNKIQRGGHILWVNYFFLLNLFEQLALKVVDSYHLYSKVKDKNSINYQLQNMFQNLFANSFGFRLVYVDKK